MGFERFEAAKMKRLAEPAVSILKSGGFGFNQAFCLRYLKETDHIQLFFDRESKTIGIRPVHERKPDAIKVRRISKGKSASVAIRPFFTYFNVPHDKTKSYPVYWNEANRWIEIRLEDKEEKKVEKKEEGVEEENDIPF